MKLRHALRAVPVGLVVAFAAESAVGVETPHSCAADARISDPCYTVHGRLSLWNGSPALRIWIVGTKRVLGVSEGRFAPDGYESLPSGFPKPEWGMNYYGNYTVCPFEKDRPGAMRLVCLSTAANVRSAARE